MHSNPTDLSRVSARKIVALILRSILFTALFLPIASPARPALAATRPVTLTINELDQLGSFDPTTLGDFYAKVTINGNEQDTSEIDFTNPFDGFIIPTGNLLPSPWVVTQNVPSDAVTVPVHIEIWDSDFPDGDDQADINPGAGQAIDLEVNMATGKWSGDVNWPDNCVFGPTDPDSNGAKICFDLNTVSTGGDLDGDGLPDTAEQRGVLDGGNNLVVDLPTFGANPFRKDIFVEADCLVAANHTHCPQQNAISDIVSAFARAPVSNEDGTTGVQLHVDTGALYGAGIIHSVPGPGGVTGTYGDFGGGGNQIPEAGNEIIESFASPKGNGVPFVNLKNVYFNSVREPYFHYVIFGHQTNARQLLNDCTSGETNGVGGHDFMVTLGGLNAASGPCWGVDAGGNSVGTRLEQGGTFMHELGHSLGLRHGGNEAIPNNKPNYLSVMNYSFQMCNVPVSPNGALPGGCDYSRIELLSPGVPLNEDSLDECVGIGGGLGFGPVNWNGNGALEGITDCQPPNNANIPADINGDSIRTLLRGFEDWSELDYLTSIGGAGGTGGTGPIGDEADPQTIQQAQTEMGNLMAPHVVVTKTGPATALPGATLNYTTQAKNQGSGPALVAMLTDTNVDGSSQNYNLGTLVVGDSQTETSSFTLPANACPGDFTGASASVAFKDIVGHALTASGSAPLQILDTVPPTISLSVSPTFLWPPDHKFQDVVATITAADNCDHHPTVTLVSVTSNEPATGFLGNGDQGPDVSNAAFGTDDRTISLRSERGTSGHSTGRIYTITYRVTDASGNTAQATATVTVPTNASKIH